MNAYDPGMQIRSLFTVALLAIQGALLAAEDLPASLATNKPGEDILWFDIQHLGVEGQGWKDTKAPYDRLPAKAEGVVRGPVWNLSRNSAGLCVRFETDATTVHARWAVLGKSLAMPHMAATGVSGLDLYVKQPNGQWHWLAVAQPKEQTNTVRLVTGIPQGRREYLMYLPLYNSTQFVEVGIPNDATLARAGAWGPGDRRPIVFYGTSILHGACASRPGMVHSAMLQRQFHRPVINLGFSGNGKMEPELADLLAELDPTVYVLNCLPNMVAKEVGERLEPFVLKLRTAHPETPIVLVEDRTYADAFLVDSKLERNLTSRSELQSAFKRLKKAGVKKLHYIPGDKLLGTDGDGTVDSSHPNDLGFRRQADVFARVLKPLLKD